MSDSGAPTAAQVYRERAEFGQLKRRCGAKTLDK
jgi:hypothetical protein